MGPEDSSLIGLLQRMPKEVQHRQVKHIDALAREWRTELRGKDPASVAYSIHRVIDEAVRKNITSQPQADKISCRRGCNHCCFVHVTVDTTEAKLLATLVREGDVSVDPERMARQLTAQGPDAWMSLPHADRRCLFNDEATGDCRVYEHRPRACRKYFVVSPPEDCNLENSYGHHVQRLASFAVEAMDTAAFQAFKPAGSIADALTNELKGTR